MTVTCTAGEEARDDADSLCRLDQIELELAGCDAVRRGGMRDGLIERSAATSGPGGAVGAGST